MQSSILVAAEFLSLAQNLVCLTGAGVSAESGVPTFRDARTGLWSRYDPDRLASPEGFSADPGLVWRWYMSRLEGVEAAQPNPGHAALARLGTLHPERFTLCTQNVDDLHERAGSRRVRHLHGTIGRFRCHLCSGEHALRPEERAAAQPPACRQCGGAVRPDVVWFGEQLPDGLLEQAWTDVRSCQVLLVAGTSGLIHPAAGLPALARRAGATVIDINPEPGPISRLATLFIAGKSGEVLPRILDAMCPS